MPAFSALLLSLFFSISAFAELPVNLLNEDSVRVLGRDTALYVIAVDLLQLRDTSSLEGRLFVADLKQMPAPLLRLRQEERRAKVYEVEGRQHRYETGLIIDVLFPRLNWTRYQSVIGDIENWSKSDPQNRQIWRVVPREPGATHALWLADLRTGYAIVLQLR